MSEPGQPYPSPSSDESAGAQSGASTEYSGGYTPAPPDDGSKRNVSAGQILAGILIVLIIIFVAENTKPVDIRLIIPVVHQVPVWIALLIAAVVGALIAWLLRVRRAKSAERKRMAKRWRESQQQ